MQPKSISRRDFVRGSALGGGAVLLGIAGGTLQAQPARASYQDGWAYCSKCKGMFYESEGAGRCPGTQGHNARLSEYYEIDYDIHTNYVWQDRWWHCKKCQGLHYKNTNPFGQCPAGGFHTNEGSHNYVLYHGTDIPPQTPGIQYAWAHCKRCQGLHYLPELPRSKCPAGGQHTGEGSYDYVLAYRV